jgi:hypothetical protein
MSALAESFLKALLDKVPREVLQSVDVLAPEIAERVKAVATVESKPLQSFFIAPKEILSRLHPSWFEDVIAACPESLRSGALLAMQEEIGIAKKTFSEQVRGFLLQQVLSQWSERSVRDVERTELPFLKTCSAEELHTLADLISLYALVPDVRKLVEKKKLQMLFERLSPIQQKYLKELLQGKRFQPSSPIEFKAFIQLTPPEALEMLHTEGLIKLGMVLKSEAAPTCWLVVHRMDKKSALLVQRGKDVEKVPCEPKQLQKKFIHAYQFLQRGDK